MGLHVPQFNREEFNCIDKSLVAVDMVCHIRKLQQELRLAQDVLEATANKYGHPLLTIQDEVLASVSDTEQSRLSPEDRLTVLTRLITDYRNNTIGIIGVPLNIQKNKLIKTIETLYSRIDKQQLITDFSTVCKVKKDSKEFAEAEKNYKNAVKALDDAESTMKKSIYNAFQNRQPPKSFRNVLVDVSMPEYDFMKYIINLFVTVWESRAPLFEVPVTINGVAINSLPAEQRKIWSSKYDKLGLGAITKRIMYFPLIREKTVVNIDQQANDTWSDLHGDN